jgi:hypothetical protein
MMASMLYALAHISDILNQIVLPDAVQVGLHRPGMDTAPLDLTATGQMPVRAF